MIIKSKRLQLLPAVFCAAALLAPIAQTQAQLLVNPDALWMRPNVGATFDGGGNYNTWQSQAVSPGNYTLQPGASPSLITQTTMGPGNAAALAFSGPTTGFGGNFQNTTLSGPIINVFAGGGTVSLAFSPQTKSGVQRLLDTTSQGGNGWELYWSAGKIGFSQRFSTSSAAWETTNSFASGGNYVMTLTYSSDLTSNVPLIYLNDSTVALTLTQTNSNSGTANSDALNRLRIGARSNTAGGETYLGKMGEVLVYNTALTGSDLTSVQTTLYNTYVIPEPNVWSLMIFGAGALLFVKRSMAGKPKTTLE